MVKIRLRRMGAKKHPFYRLVVADARSPRDGRFIEHLGYYDPMTDPVQIKIDVDRVKLWLQQGAQPSEAARSLLKREGILERHAVPREARCLSRLPSRRAWAAVCRRTSSQPLRTVPHRGWLPSLHL